MIRNVMCYSFYGFNESHQHALYLKTNKTHFFYFLLSDKPDRLEALTRKIISYARFFKLECIGLFYACFVC